MFSAIFISCPSEPETGMNRVIYKIEGSEPMVVSLSDNPPWNFQCLIPLREGVNLSSGDVISLDIVASSDMDIGILKFYLVDRKSSGTDWNVISDFYDVYYGIIAEYDVVKNMPTIEFTTLTARLYH